MYTHLGKRLTFFPSFRFLRNAEIEYKWKLIQIVIFERIRDGKRIEVHLDEISKLI